MIPGIAALIMGVVIGLINMLLSKTIGNVLTVLVGITLGVIVYFLALILLKGVDENDLRSMPGGSKVLVIAKKFRLM